MEFNNKPVKTTSNDLPIVLEQLALEINQNDIVKARISKNQNNRSIYYFYFTRIYSTNRDYFERDIIKPSTIKFKFGEINLALSKIDLLTDFDNGRKYLFQIKDSELPALINAMENGNKIIMIIKPFLPNKVNQNNLLMKGLRLISDSEYIESNPDEIKNYLILPNEKNLDIDQYVELLSNNEKIFIKYNDIWTIRYENEFTQLKDIKCISYIYYMLSRPFKDISLEKIYYDLNEGNPIYEGEAVQEVREKGAESDQIKNYQDEIKKLKGEYKIVEIKAESASDFNDDEKSNEYLKEMKAIEDNIYKYKSLIRDIENSLKRNIQETLPEREKIRSTVSHSFTDFYNMIRRRKLTKFLKYLKSSIKVYRGYTYAPLDNSESWVLHSSILSE